MTGVPGVRLRGVQLALDAIGKTETVLRAEAVKLEALFGPDSPIVKRAHGHAVYLRNIFDLVTADTASCDTQPEAGDVEQAPLVSGAVGDLDTIEGIETPITDQSSSSHSIEVEP